MPNLTDHLFIGRNKIELDRIDSTNKYAKALLANTKPSEGTAIITDEQFNGRGQIGNKWHSEPFKNLILSLILYPTFLSPNKQFYLNMAVSLAVKDFCEAALSREIFIKWPNDIYFERKKLGGILIENTISGSKLTESVVGIGLNINQRSFDDSLPNPISFINILEEELRLSDLTEKLFALLEKYYLQLRQGHYHFLEKAYTESLFLYQHTNYFKAEGEVFRGEIIGVSKEGKLIIQSNGKDLKFAFKEVEYVL